MSIRFKSNTTYALDEISPFSYKIVEFPVKKKTSFVFAAEFSRVAKLFSFVFLIPVKLCVKILPELDFTGFHSKVSNTGHYQRMFLEEMRDCVVHYYVEQTC